MVTQQQPALEVGSYALFTRWADRSPSDPWFVGAVEDTKVNEYGHTVYYANCQWWRHAFDLNNDHERGAAIIVAYQVAEHRQFDKESLEAFVDKVLYDVKKVEEQRYGFPKPSWSDAPVWAMYLAQDKDGNWCWFELEPRCRLTAWCVSDRGGRFRIDEHTVPNWKETLEKRL